jgi:hypothetical protein
MNEQRWLAAIGIAVVVGGCSGGDGGDASAGGQAGASATGGAGSAPSAGGAGGGGAAGQAGAPAGGAAGQAGGAAGAGGCARFVTHSTAHAFGPGQNTGQAAFPKPLLGPPRGGGATQGSMDVVSLGNGGTVTLAFGQTRIVDGAGPDFIVFENAFLAGGDPSAPFAELARVEVSLDGQTWVAFPCAVSSPPYGSCAGWHPVFANADENDIDPLDPSVAGGDAFDLADVGLGEARFVRITDRADLTGMDGVFDLDAVGVVNAACP